MNKEELKPLSEQAKEESQTLYKNNPSNVIGGQIN